MIFIFCQSNIYIYIYIYIYIENISGKAYLKVINMLDKEVEVQVPILRLKPLNELFDNYKSNVEAQDNQKKVADMQSDSVHPEDNQIHCEISNINVNS